MKKLLAIALLTSLLVSSIAGAEEIKNKDNFAKHKAEIIIQLSQEKVAVDNAISCINSANKREDTEKCREQKKSSMDKLKQERIAGQKARLQDQIKRLDEESSKEAK